MTAAAGPQPAADFVRRFERFWSTRSLELLDDLFVADARMEAPMTPTTRTLAEGKRAFAAIFELIPDLGTEVHAWGPTEDGVLIDFTASGTAAGTPVSWRAVDRFVVGEDGLATERVSFFDPLPLVLALLRHPRSWPVFLRSRRRGGRRAR